MIVIMVWTILLTCTLPSDSQMVKSTSGLIESEQEAKEALEQVSTYDDQSLLPKPFVNRV